MARLNIVPQTVEVDPEDPVAYVLSLNLHRRHLTVSQAAMCAQRARKMYDDAAKERQKATLKKGDEKPVPDNCSERDKGEARDQVGQAFGVSGGTVDPVAYVLSLNLHRRHLTVSQAAMCAQRARKMYDDKAKERQKALGRTHGADPSEQLSGRGEARDQVGQAFGVSGGTVDRARVVTEKGIPEIAQAVDAGKISVHRGKEIATSPPALCRKAKRRPTRPVIAFGRLKVFRLVRPAQPAPRAATRARFFTNAPCSFPPPA